MAAISWPAAVLRPRSIQFDPEPRSRSGGVSLSGVEQIVASGAGRWKATLGGIAIRASAQIRLWRALQGLLDGRTGTALVPLCDCARTPWPIVGGAPLRGFGDIPHDDEALFSDDSGYWQNVIIAYTTANAVRGATALALNIDRGNALEGGEHVSIGERLYRVAAILSGGASPLGGWTYTVRIWPPLREAAPLGTGLNFDRPQCRMRLASDDAMDVALDLGRFASPSVSFVEDL